ncbi:MAG: hypothetical protein V4819_08995 [Verrucomicrobiota bacterium]
MIKHSLGITLVGILLTAGVPAMGRTWTNAQGRTFEAEFVRLDGANVIFQVPGSRTFATPLVDLSVGDQMVLKKGAGTLAGLTPAVASTFNRAWPREVRLDGPVACKVVSEDRRTRKFVYESPAYRFTCDARVTDDALRNFSVMFETIRKYAQNMPLSLGGGRERLGKLDVLLFASAADYAKAGGPAGTAGCFVNGVVLVPMDSLGLKEGGTGFSLDSTKHNIVLVHELVHQLTPDAYMSPGALGWFSEGLAEYMAITPYNWGYFKPDIHGSVVKSYVTGTGANGLGGRALGTNLTVPRLRNFLLMPYGQFMGANGNYNYGMGLLLTHYFFHMEGGGKAFRITQFLKGLEAGQRGEASLAPLLGGGSYEKLEGEITAAWARLGVQIRFGG